MLAHEVEHSRQWRRHKNFLGKYVFSARFRYAMELQAVREEMRAMNSAGSSLSQAQQILKHFYNSLERVYLIRFRE